MECGCGVKEVSWRLQAEVTLGGQGVVLGDLVIRRCLGLPLDSDFRAWVRLTGKVVPRFSGIVLQSGRVIDVSGTAMRTVGERVGAAEEPGLGPELELEQLHPEEPGRELEPIQQVEKFMTDATEVYVEQVEAPTGVLHPELYLQARVRPVRVDLAQMDLAGVQQLGPLDPDSPDSSLDSSRASEEEEELAVKVEVQEQMRGPTVSSMFDRKSARCTECNQYVVRCKQLRHLQAQHGWEPLQCPSCDYVSDRASTLASHIARKHGAGGPRDECPQCGKEMDRKWLVGHIDSQHSGVVVRVGLFRFCGPSGTLQSECNCAGGAANLDAMAKALPKKFACRLVGWLVGWSVGWSVVGWLTFQGEDPRSAGACWGLPGGHEDDGVLADGLPLPPRGHPAVQGRHRVGGLGVTRLRDCEIRIN